MHSTTSITLLLFQLTGEFFSLLLTLYRAKEIDDAYIIPVSVNYDILPEEDLLESFQVVGPTGTDNTPSLNFLWNCFKTSRGIVRVGFSQPFRLRVSLARVRPIDRQAKCLTGIKDRQKKGQNSLQFLTLQIRTGNYLKTIWQVI
jgi:hypothetical protein